MICMIWFVISFSGQTGHHRPDGIEHCTVSDSGVNQQKISEHSSLLSLFTIMPQFQCGSEDAHYGVPVKSSRFVVERDEGNDILCVSEVALREIFVRRGLLTVEHDKCNDLVIQLYSNLKSCRIERSTVRRHDVIEPQCFVFEHNDLAIHWSELESELRFCCF